MEPRDAKILLYDIETFPITNLGWGPKYESNMVHIIDWSHMLSFSYMWLGEDSVQCFSLRDAPKYKANTSNDKWLCEQLFELFESSDIRVAHNGDMFDEKSVKTRFAFHGMRNPGRAFTVDTKKAVKRHWRLPSNALADVAQFFGLGNKTPHTGFDLWLQCQAGDDKAWALMEEYNANDTVLLQDVYLLLRDGGWLDNHPNLATITGQLESCPKCLAPREKLRVNQRRPYTATATRIAVQYICTVCRSCSTRTETVPLHKPLFK